MPHTWDDELPGVSRHEVQLGADGAGATWGIAVECAVEITLNGAPWTVMLATPADLRDLAMGLAITEHVLRDASAVRDVTIARLGSDVSVDLHVDEDALDRSALRARSLPGGTACGLCGIESLAALHARRPRPGDSAYSHANGDRAQSRSGDSAYSATETVGDSAYSPGSASMHCHHDGPESRTIASMHCHQLGGVPDDAIARAFAALPAWQPLNTATRSVHAAAWCDLSGTILLAREDVGRHNALDKLVGAMAQGRMLAAPGFIVMTSRCSYELVHKASITGAGLLATVSAPTSMALQWSAALGLPLASRAGARVVRFTTEGARAAT